MTRSKLPPYLALRALAAVSRHRSVTKAARELNVTHAAISHQIKLLEAWFEQPLFRRVGRGSEPLPDAVRLGHAVDAANSDLARACMEIAQGTKGPDLVVAVIPSFASRWLVPQLPEFQKLHPAIRLHLVYAISGTVLDGADIVIDAHIGPMQRQSRQITVKLMDGRTFAVCSKHFLGGRKAPLDFTKLDPGHLLHDETPETWGHWMSKVGVNLPRRTRGPVFQDFNLLTTALMAGHGVALCPTRLFESELASGDLAQLSPIPANEDKAYWMTIGQPRKPENQHFEEWIMSLLPNAPA